MMRRAAWFALGFAVSLSSCHVRPPVSDSDVNTGSTVADTGDDENTSGDTENVSCPDGCFEAVEEIALPVGVRRRLLVGDFDGDGRADLASGDGTVLFREAEPAFATPVNLDLADDEEVLLTADINGDGRTDLLGRASNGALIVFLADSQRAFGPGIVIDALDGPTGPLFAEDFDGDGRDDVAVLAYTSGQNQLAVLRGQLDGSLVTTSLWDVSGSPAAVAGGHVDDDEHIDLVVANHGSLRVYHGRGDGTFEVSVDLFEGLDSIHVPFRSPADSGLRGVALAACSGAFEHACGLALLSAPSDTLEIVSTVVGLGPHTLGLAVGDFRGDGRGAVVAHMYEYEDGDALRLLCSQGGGTYLECETMSISVNFSFLAAIDMNDDALDDLVLVEADVPSLYVIHAKP